MYFTLYEKMLEVCFSTHPNIYYRTTITNKNLPYLYITSSNDVLYTFSNTYNTFKLSVDGQQKYSASYGSHSSSSSSGSYSADTDISNSDKVTCWVLAKEAVKKQLKSPSSAEFAFSASSSDVKISIINGQYVVTSYVDAQNSFGAMMRNTFIVTLSKSGSNFKVISCTLY